MISLQINDGLIDRQRGQQLLAVPAPPPQRQESCWGGGFPPAWTQGGQSCPFPFNDSFSCQTALIPHRGGGRLWYSLYIIQQDGGASLWETHSPLPSHPLSLILAGSARGRGGFNLFPFFTSKIIYKPTLQYVQKKYKNRNPSPPKK